MVPLRCESAFLGGARGTCRLSYSWDVGERPQRRPEAAEGHGSVLRLAAALGGRHAEPSGGVQEPDG